MRAPLNIGAPSLNSPETEIAIVVLPERLGLKAHEPVEFLSFTVQTFLPLTMTDPVPDARGFGATGVRIQARFVAFSQLAIIPLTNAASVRTAATVSLFASTRLWMVRAHRRVH